MNVTERVGERFGGAKGRLAPQGVSADVDLSVQNEEAVAAAAIRIGGIVMNLVPGDQRAVAGVVVGCSPRIAAFSRPLSGADGRNTVAKRGKRGQRFFFVSGAEMASIGEN